MRAVHLLYLMSTSNEGRSPRLPYTEFFNKEVSRRADLAQEYMIWRHTLVLTHPSTANNDSLTCVHSSQLTMLV